MRERDPISPRNRALCFYAENARDDRGLLTCVASLV
jgi:hypothetical protein